MAVFHEFDMDSITGDPVAFSEYDSFRAQIYSSEYKEGRQNPLNVLFHRRCVHYI